MWGITEFALNFAFRALYLGTVLNFSLLFFL